MLGRYNHSDCSTNGYKRRYSLAFAYESERDREGECVHFFLLSECCRCCCCYCCSRLVSMCIVKTSILFAHLRAKIKYKSRQRLGVPWVLLAVLLSHCVCVAFGVRCGENASCNYANDTPSSLLKRSGDKCKSNQWLCDGPDKLEHFFFHLSLLFLSSICLIFSTRKTTFL